MRDGWGAWLEEEGQIRIEGIWSDSGEVGRVSLVGECGGKLEYNNSRLGGG